MMTKRITNEVLEERIISVHTELKGINKHLGDINGGLKENTKKLGKIDPHEIKKNSKHRLMMIGAGKFLGILTLILGIIGGVIAIW